MDGGTEVFELGFFVGKWGRDCCGVRCEEDNERRDAVPGIGRFVNEGAP